jgi:hypothetical protein
MHKVYNPAATVGILYSPRADKVSPPSCFPPYIFCTMLERKKKTAVAKPPPPPWGSSKRTKKPSKRKAEQDEAESNGSDDEADVKEGPKDDVELK